MNKLLAGLVVAAAVSASAPVVAAGTPQPALLSGKASRSLLLDVANTGKRLVAVGERGHILISTDQGKSWRQVASPVRSMLTTVYFVDELHGWAVGHDSAILATVDGGDTWAVQHYKEFDPAAAEAAADEAAMDDAALDDATFDEEDTGRDVGSREGVPLLDVWFADSSRGLAIGAYGLLMRTVDGGKTWVDASDTINNRDGWHFNAIGGLPGNPRVVLIAGEKGTLYRSLDGGASFASVASPYDGSFFGITGTRAGSLYVYGLQGRLYRSDDSGGSWQRMETGVTSGLNDGCELEGGALMVTGNAGVVLVRPAAGGELATTRRADRQAVLSCAAAGNGSLLVGEGGAKSANALGNNP